MYKWLRFFGFSEQTNVLQTKYPFCSPYSFLCNNWIISLPPLWLRKHYLLATETKGSLENKSVNGAEDGAEPNYPLCCGVEEIKRWQNFTTEAETRSLYKDCCGWIRFLTWLLCQNLLLRHQSQDGSICLWLHCPSSIWQVNICSCHNKISQNSSLRALGQQNEEKVTLHQKATINCHFLMIVKSSENNA